MMLVLGFAETINHFPKSDRITPIHDDQDFPPLALAANNDSYEIIQYEDDISSYGSIAFVNHRSYCEVATQAGVEHGPVLKSNSYDHCKKTFHVKRNPKVAAQTTDHLDSNNCQHNESDPWYQVKCLRRRKSHPDFVRQKQKTLEVAFRRVAREYIKFHQRQQQQLKAMRYEMLSAHRHTEIYKVFRKQLRPTYYRRGIYRIVRSGSITFIYLNSPSDQLMLDDTQISDGSRRVLDPQFRDKQLKTMIMNHAQKPLLEDLVDIGYHYYGIRWSRKYQPADYNYEVEYYRIRYQGVWKYIMIPWEDHERCIKPQLKAAYDRAKRRYMTALSNALPSPKDRSSCRISCMQYARNTLVSHTY